MSSPRTTGLHGSETPRHSGCVRPHVLRSVLFEYEVRRGTIENLLSLVAPGLSPRVFSLRVDERHGFRLCSLDGRTSAFSIPLGKDVVQVAAPAARWQGEAQRVGLAVEDTSEPPAFDHRSDAMDLLR